MIDFTEIPPANHPSGGQDIFELFTCTFLELIGFKIISGPNRGADDGIDLIVSEPTGITNSQTNWVVSAKHYAHSGKSVGVRDELDISDRVNQAGAEGFLGFYSTIPSAGLEKKLCNLQSEGKIRKFYVFNSGKISQSLTSDNRLNPILKFYFPRSYQTIKGLQKNNRLLLSAWTGINVATQEKIPIEVPNILDSDEPGIYRVADPEMEAVMVACLIAQNLAKNNFDILKPFVSFNHKTWKHLRVFLAEGIISGSELGNAILKTDDSIQLRLLISIAGYAHAYKAVDAICRQLIFNGRIHDSRLRELGFTITPFFDIVKNCLVQLSKDNELLIANYANKAKVGKKWKEYRLFKHALEWEEVT